MTQPADHEKNVKAGGTRGSARGWANSSSKAEAREEELEQATSRNVKSDEQSQREPAVRRRQALDGGQ